jgi:DNA polymerase III delta prime subunit
MLKRKCGNGEQTLCKKRIKKSKKIRTADNYEQQTISQTSFFIVKTPMTEPFTLHQSTQGILTSYLKDYKSRVKHKNYRSENSEKTILIQGPAGSGKTHFVRSLALSLNLKLLELNVSSHRNKGTVCRVLGEACQTFAIDQKDCKGTIVFIDDADIELESDKGFYSGIESIISDNKCPVILACIELPEQLAKNGKIKVLKFEGFKEKIIEFVRKIIDAQEINITDAELENIYVKAKGNLNTLLMYIVTQVGFN